MKEFIENLPDGCSIYICMIVAAIILIVAVYALRWAAKNDQFDVEIKYLVFNSDDQDKMEPYEFAKSRAVNEEQQRLRKEYLDRKAELRAEKHAGG